MEKVTSEQLNQAAMQMIMLAGDSRTLLTEVINETLEGASAEEVDEKIKSAKEKIVEAHRIQTDMIQSSIEDNTFILACSRYTYDYLLRAKYDKAYHSYVSQIIGTDEAITGRNRHEGIQIYHYGSYGDACKTGRTVCERSISLSK